MIEQITGGIDGRVCAHGKINGRAYVADGATKDEAIEFRKQLRQQAARKHRMICRRVRLRK